MERNVEVRPTTGAVVPWADGLRGLAVLAVIVSHCLSYAGNPSLVVFGHDLAWAKRSTIYAVETLFIMSGYLLAQPWFMAEFGGRRRRGVLNFWKRRFLRLAPAYYVSMLIVIPLFLKLGMIAPESLTGRIGLVNIGSHLTFTHYYVPIGASEFNGANASLWTLTPEMTFYLALPAAVLTFRGRRWAGAIPVAAGIALTWLWLARNSLGGVVQLWLRSLGGGTAEVMKLNRSEDYWRGVLAEQVPAHLLTFALGVGLARLVAIARSRPAEATRAGWEHPRCAAVGLAAGITALLDVSYLAGTASVDSASHPVWGYYLHRVAAGVALALIIYGLSFGTSRMQRPLSVLPIRYFGWISYSAFLYHFPILMLLSHQTSLTDLSPGSQFLVAFGLTLVLSIAIGSASFLLVERPFLVPGGLWNYLPVHTRRLRERVQQGQGRPLTTPIVPVLALAGFLVIWQAPQSFTPSSAREVGAVSAPFGVPRDGILSPGLSGSMSVTDAQALGIIYPDEAELLRSCGARQGETEVLATPTWGLSASLFTCHDMAAAAAVVSSRADLELGRGLEELSLDGPTARVFISTANTTAGFPARVVVTFASGSHIIGILVQGRSLARARSGATTMLARAAASYPPG